MSESLPDRTKLIRQVGRPCRTCGQYVRLNELRDHGQLCVFCAPPKIRDRKLAR